MQPQRLGNRAAPEHAPPDPAADSLKTRASLTLAALACALASILSGGSQARAQPLNVETECSVVGEFDGKPEVAVVQGLQVLGGPQAFSIPLPQGAKLAGLMCDRTDFLPDPTDVRVIKLFNAPFYISTPDRVVKFDREGQGYSVTLIDGPAWTAADEARIKGLLSLITFLGR